jgi:hypothetical protein
MFDKFYVIVILIKFTRINSKLDCFDKDTDIKHEAQRLSYCGLLKIT